VTTGRLAFAAAFLLTALEASSQGPAPTPRPIVSTMEVSVTNVDVVVTDSKGNRVRDLAAADFEIVEDGKRQDVSNFLFVDEGQAFGTGLSPEAGARPPLPEPGVLSPAVPRPVAKVTVFIDVLHILPANRVRVLRALEEFLNSRLGPNAEAMIVTFDRALRPRGPFTRDARALGAVLAGIAVEATPGAGTYAERQRLFREIDQAAQADSRSRNTLFDSAILSTRGYSEKVRYDAEATLNGVRVTLGRLSGVEGRKVLILVSEKLSASPGFEVWEYLRAALRSVGMSDQRPDIPQLGAEEYSIRPKARALAEAANAANVTLYTFDSAGLGFEVHTSSEFGGLDTAVDTTTSTVLDESMLQALADETGGVAALRRNDVSAVLTELERDWQTYYSLGYATPPNRENRPRSVSVRVRRPGLKVRTRHAVLERSADARLAEQISSALFFPRQQNPLDARIDVGRLKKSGKSTYVVPLSVRIPHARLTLVPDGNRLRGGFLFAGAVRAPDDRYTDVIQKRVAVDVPASDAAGTFLFETTFEIRPGRQVFSIALVDEISRTTSFLQPEMNLGPRDAAR
jgi:VWFA-related protein